MRKMTLLFAALLSLASTTTKAETLTADFDSELPAGWSIVGDLTRDPDRAKSGSGVWTSSKSNDANYLVTEPVEGSITFYARAYNKSTDAYVFIYAYDGSALGDKLYESKNMKAYSTPSWSEYTADLGDYKGQVAIALNYAAIDDVTYTGRAGESYCDMREQFPIRQVSCRVADMTEPNIRPQESGNRMDCTEAAVSDGERTVSFEAVEKPFELGIKPYTDKALCAMRHIGDEKRTGTYVTIQAFQQGIGTGACGPAIMPEYQFPAKKDYELRFIIRAR